MDQLASITPLPMAASTAITGEISNFINNSLSFMPGNCLIPFPTDPSFKERAARYSSFSSDDYREAQVGILVTGKLSRASSSQSLKSKENSSVTDLCSSPGESNARKRKTTPKSEAKLAEECNLNVKKRRSAETNDENVGFKLNEVHNGEKKQEKNGSELPDPPKNYIHVRARRGQATDSHSLAERVRREKISLRMKLLQDLVPGCNKITGKALMLDEIINYVQSLQRQVEFLSMKLATLNPRLDCNLSNLVSKEPFMGQPTASLPSLVYSLDNLAVTFPCTHQSNEGSPLHFCVTKGMETHNPFSQVNYTLYQSPYMQPTSLDVSGATASQLGNLWDDDLHSLVQMNLVHDQAIGFTSQNFHGQLAANNMKEEP